MNDYKAFLKWAGGKTKVVPYIKEFLKQGNRLVEPFVGSGALFLNTDYDDYLLCDINADLINLYNHLKTNPDILIKKTRELFVSKNNNEDKFYDIRKEFNSLPIGDIRKSAIFIYLNKHAFNGLCRYNSKGHFNVPFGRYKNPLMPEDKMISFHMKSQKATFKCQDFNITFKEIKSGDIVYCDPPYVPISASSNFTSYSSGGFDYREQIELAENCEGKARKISNV